MILAIGFFIGSLTKPEISGWYSYLKISPMTPPNYVFSIVWSFLYSTIGLCGWLIWSNEVFDQGFIKALYVLQLILNWCWMPLFFGYHLIGLALFVLFCMDFFLGAIIYLSYKKIRLVSWLLLPYFFWILFATYLNFYIFIYN